MNQLIRSLSERLGVVRSPQAYIISYPKTGRTWLRTLVGRYLVESRGVPESLLLETERATARAGLRRTAVTHDGSEMVSRLGWAELNPDKSKYAAANVLLVGRDIRDTLVSAFFQASKRVDMFDDSISEFIRSGRFGVRKVLTFYEHWLAGRHVPEDFLFLTYELLHRDPVSVLTRTLTFLGESDVNARGVEASVEFCAFENMRRAEAENRFDDEVLRPTDGGDPESYKLRRGVVGGYADYLSVEDVSFIDRTIADAGFDFARFDD